MNEILEFIQRRWKKDCDWTNGNCYWFAYILTTRFNNLKIYYLPIEGHFVAGDGITFYDFHGINNLQEKPYLFSQLELEEPHWYKRIVRDCIL